MKRTLLGALIYLLFQHQFSLSAAGSRGNKNSHTNPSLCSLDCSGSRRRPVCGSDGRTYSSRCELDRASCRRRDLRVGYRGECLSVSERCFEERRKATKASNDSGIDIFIPECHPNGKYVDVQCHYGTGYCWCVNDNGKPVPGSSVRYKKPKCNKKVSRKRTRRGKKGTRKRHAKRICSQSDRMQFNNYVIERITSEFRESGQVLDSTSHYYSRKSNPKKEMVNWKFRSLDADSNGIVKRREFGEFRRDIKRNSRNKQCAITFWKHCDLNDDKNMTPSEWTTCLGVDVNVSFRLFLSLNSKEDPLKEERGTEEEHSIEGSNGLAIIDDKQVSMEDPSVSTTKGCGQDRSKTSNIDKDGGFVPECAPDGKYKRVQCFRSTGYCWCADEQTGAPIPGTSRQNAIPDCSEHLEKPLPVSLTSPAPSHRPWKKCTEMQKKEFQRNIIEVFKVLYSRNHEADTSGDLSDKEAVVLQWQFTVMDRNRDGVLSKKEMRPLRVKIKRDHRLKRCGKRLPINCDIDQSNSISLSEWDICFGLKKEPGLNSSVASLNGKRRGVNPLKKYLISD